jgi:hypothetical protein
MNWIGGIFVAAAVAIAFAIISDVAMTRCQPNSFAVVIGLCTVGTDAKNGTLWPSR